jgi:hypothetical protein
VYTEAMNVSATGAVACASLTSSGNVNCATLSCSYLSSSGDANLNGHNLIAAGAYLTTAVVMNGVQVIDSSRNVNCATVSCSYLTSSGDANLNGHNLYCGTVSCGTVNTTSGYGISGLNGYLLDDAFTNGSSDRYGLHMNGGIMRMYTSGFYSGSALALSLATGTGTFTDYLYVTHAGNVGIGTTPAAAYTLDVNGTLRVNSTRQLYNKLLVLYDPAGGSTDPVSTATNFYGFGINNSTLRYQSAANHTFYCGGTQTLKIDTAGKVTCGGVDANGVINAFGNTILCGDIGATGTVSANSVAINGSTVIDSSRNLGGNSVAINGVTVIDSSRNLVNIQGTINTTSGFRSTTNANYFGANSGVQMQIGSMGTTGIAALVSPASMEFYVNGDSFGTNVAVSLSANFNPLMTVNGNTAIKGSIYPLNDNSFSCGTSGNRWNLVYAVNGAIQTSDEADKVSEPLPYGLREVEQMTTIKYRWKTQADLPDDDPTKAYEYYGVCARELDALFPELVYNESSPYQLNYSELVPVLVNAVKDLAERNRALEARSQTLEARSQTLEAELAKLRAYLATKFSDVPPS